jgi:hypothetical protein
MFRIRMAHGEPQARPMRRRRTQAGSGRFRTSQDFSVRAYQHFNTNRAGAVGPVWNAIRAVGRVAETFTRNLLEAMYESRRRQAMSVRSCYCAPVDAGERAARSQITMGADGTSVDPGAVIAPATHGMTIRCSITSAPCEGDRAYLCEEWGCARKGGLSPISHENA